MDAGGLAQMTYNNFHQNGAPSFGSRGKGSHLRNISVPGPNSLSPSENQPVPTPRTARSALLAGLRTAPKTPTLTPTSNAEYGGDNSRYAGISTSSGYGNGNMSHQNQQRLPTPPSTSSPSIQVNDGDPEECDDSYQQIQMMMAQNAYFAQLQQQLAAAKVQQLQQQLAQLQMQSGYSATPPMSPGMGLYNTNAAAAAAAIYSQYNNNPYQQYGQPQNTGYGQQQQQQQQIQQLQQLQQLQQQQQQQQQLLQQYQQQQQQQQQQAQQQAQQQKQQQQYYQQQQSPLAQVEISPPTPIDPPTSNGLSMNGSRANSRSRSPPKLNLQQSNNAAANSSAAAGFRRGHRKASSLSTCTIANGQEIAEAPKTSLPNLSKLPTTPMTATFGPGHASGTHPMRQPRGPPSIEELKAKPTSKDEGSKNFATRQRRRAISRLVSASTERRSARSTSGTASAGGTMTPVSENEGFAFETDSVGSGAGRNSRQSLRDYEHNSSSADEESVSGRFGNQASGGLKAPELVSSAADKRKSALF